MPHFDFALVLLATFSLASALGAEKDSRPNLLFFFPDTLRAESFNSYGNTVPNVTPNFDRFAKSGTRFEQAHVMHTQCSPSRATMMTGRYMHVLGHRTQIHLIRAYEENYWRLLKESGYHVQWYGKNDALSATAFNLSVSAWELARPQPSKNTAQEQPTSHPSKVLILSPRPPLKVLSKHILLPPQAI